MKLILTEYIESLKEDGELDKLIQEILKSYGITIFAAPEKGRQYGVDIYAIGKDFEDGGKKKVFLITVKQGDLDRQTWNGNQNAVYQSLEEIKTTFLHSNLAKQHKKLPVKIVVAFNGMFKQSLEQSWRGYEEANPGFEYRLWNSGWLLEQFEKQLLNEQSFSSGTRSFVRKTIIHLENPAYDLADYSALLQSVSASFKATTAKRSKLRQMRELQVIVAIILKYAKENDNLSHSIRIVEKYILMLWAELSPGEPDKAYTGVFIASFDMVLHAFMDYYHKIGYAGLIRDGFSRRASDPVTYTYTVYEQLGILSMNGLILVQMAEIIRQSADKKEAALAENFLKKAKEVGTAVFNTCNNNPILFSPRADDQHIEICILFVLLAKLGLWGQVNELLHVFNQQMGEGVLFLNVFPEFNNSLRRVAELESDYDKRINHVYKASNLFTVLTEWCAIASDERTYRLFYNLKQNLLKETELVLWFPEPETEQKLYTQDATRETGYTLSNCVLPESMAEYRQLIAMEFEHNCYEKEFGFMKQGLWCIGLLASRHYRTYIFPYYWRQFLNLAAH